MATDEGGAVLVVDDDEINRLLISTLLENQGYGTRTAADGDQALAALEETRFDVVLLDVVMPRVDGIEVLRTMKRDSRLWDIPVIMISSVEETRSIVCALSWAPPTSSPNHSIP
jgi:CheY-like chemotaxis protein